MKKLFFMLCATCSLFIFSCTGAHNQTGGATRDSSANHGNSGPADSSKATGSDAPVGVSAASPTTGSDTSHTGKSTASPTVDSGKHK